MRILIVTGIYPPAIGGSATYSALLNRELPKRGFGVSVLTYGNPHLNPPPSKEGGGVGGGLLYCVSNRWPKGLRHLIYFLKLLFLGRKYDLILAADSSFGAATIAVFAARLIGKKVIVRVTGDYAWEQGMQRFGVKDLIDEFQNKKYGLSVQLLKKLQSYAVRKASVVIAPSEYLKKMAVGWGAGLEKVNVIYNAVDIPPLNPPPSRKGEERGGANFLIISAGRLVPWKGFDILIEAVAELRQDIPEIKLIIVGSGPDKKRLASVIASNPPIYPIGYIGGEARQSYDNFLLIDSLPKFDLAKKIIASDVFVLNTAYEGFSHQIVEAMSLGVPVITTKVGGNPEIIRDGENGLLIGYNDKEALKQAILKLYKDRELVSRIGKNGEESARKFTKEAMLVKVIDLFNSIR